MSKAVLVRNLLSFETDTSIRDHFSFCGKVVNVSIFPSTRANQHIHAVIDFETAEAAQTALFLNGQDFYEIDNPLSIELYTWSSCEVQPEPQPQVRARQVPRPEPQISAPINRQTESPSPFTGFISTILATTLNFGSDVLAKVKEFDEEREISKKVGEINAQYHLTGTVQDLGSRVTTKAHEVDDSFEISDKVSSAFDTIVESIDDGLSVVQAKALESPLIFTGMEKIHNLSGGVIQVITPHAENLKSGLDDIKFQTMIKLNRD